MPLAGVLTAYLAFEAGGFFPGAIGIAGAALAVALVELDLLSDLWSYAPARAIIEFDRVRAYWEMTAPFAWFFAAGGVTA
jgi:hypothetical protein